MEHRWSVRIPSTAEVTIRLDNLTEVVCSASDIALGGLLVKTGPLSCVRKNTVLEIEIKLDTYQGLERFHMAARVVYQNNTGMGLMFLDSNPVLFRSIRRMMLDNVRHQTSLHENGLTHTPGMV